MPAFSLLKTEVPEVAPEAARSFIPPGDSLAGIRPHGDGNINTTFLVTTRSGFRFILQRINEKVFNKPALVMANMRRVTDHIGRHPVPVSHGNGRRWETPFILSTFQGADWWIAPDGGFWRAQRFIENVRSFHSVRNEAHAREVGWALGTFQGLIGDLPLHALADTLEGFHVTPGYLRRYDTVLASSSPCVSPGWNRCVRFIEERRAGVGVLEDAAARGQLVRRPIHGDPKVDNVMTDMETGLAVAMVDLDTVKPGLIQYDIGDCLRSACNTGGEEIEAWEYVRFDTDVCRAVLEGYVEAAGGFLTSNDFALIYDSVRLIAFELGLRFFTDYLEGNVYFKVKRSDHNLLRASAQFRLTESIEDRESLIRTVVDDQRRKVGR